MVSFWNITIPELTGDKERRIYVYLPDSYETEPEKHYPVLYMFDGHNVFFDSHATYGKSWGMKDYMDRTKTELIIVAVECNHEGNGRLCEYSPVNFSNHTVGKVIGRGSIYMDWLVNTCKPMIDEMYRTLPDREHTMIAGSSMGGLMSLYAVSVYNHIFSKAACLSPSIWIGQTRTIKFLQDVEMTPDTVIYFDYGSEELANHTATRTALSKTMNHLYNRGINLTFRIVPGGSHCEASWEKQIPIFFGCLGIES